MYGVVSPMKLPIGIEYRVANNENDTLPKQFRVKQFNQRSFETTAKGLARTQNLYIENSVECGNEFGKDGTYRLIHPRGSWFKVEKVCQNETIKESLSE
jgi:hypothetical protein